MNIDEKIQEIQRKLVKILTKGYNREDTILTLEQLGLEKNFAIKLLDSFEQMNKDKKIVENAWNTEELGEFLNNIENHQINESESIKYFENLNNKISLMVLAKEIHPEEINEELLDKLNQEGIKENEITNSSLKVAYHYYNKSKETDEKMLQIANENIKIKTFYNNLQRILRNRIKSDERHYQDALKKIDTLNKKVIELQNRSIFKTIGSKIVGILKNRRAELPDSTNPNIPHTLYENINEKMDIEIYGEDNKYEVSKYINNAEEIKIENEEMQH